jgi:hypothetical protein
MNKGRKWRKLACAVGAGLLFSAFWTLHMAIQQGNLPDTCTLDDLLYAIRRSGGWGNAIVAFGIVAYMVEALFRSATGNEYRNGSITYTERPQEPMRFGINGSLMASESIDVNGNPVGSTRF